MIFIYFEFQLEALIRWLSISHIGITIKLIICRAFTFRKWLIFFSFPLFRLAFITGSSFSSCSFSALSLLNLLVLFSKVMVILITRKFYRFTFIAQFSQLCMSFGGWHAACGDYQKSSKELVTFFNVQHSICFIFCVCFVNYMSKRSKINKVEKINK